MAMYQDDAQDTGLRGPVPRDARLIALILASMGVSDVEPAVLLQLLEFAHRYTYDVLSDALVYADHASARQASSSLSLDDVNLAIQSRVNYSFTKPPEKDVSPLSPNSPCRSRRPDAERDCSNRCCWHLQAR
jgi:hypothetical protein